MASSLTFRLAFVSVDGFRISELLTEVAQLAISQQQVVAVLRCKATKSQAQQQQNFNSTRFIWVLLQPVAVKAINLIAFYRLKPSNICKLLILRFVALFCCQYVANKKLLLLLLRLSSALHWNAEPTGIGFLGLWAFKRDRCSFSSVPIDIDGIDLTLIVRVVLLRHISVM